MLDIIQLALYSVTTLLDLLQLDVRVLIILKKGLLAGGVGKFHVKAIFFLFLTPEQVTSPI